MKLTPKQQHILTYMTKQYPAELSAYQVAIALGPGYDYSSWARTPLRSLVNKGILQVRHQQGYNGNTVLMFSFGAKSKAAFHYLLKTDQAKLKG